MRHHTKFFFISVLLCFSVVSCAYGVSDFLYVPVKDAIGISEKYHKKAFSRSDWKIVRMLYNEHVLNNPKWSDKPRIPKIIHHIWLGSPFPEKYKVLYETWKKNHPDWEFILWTDEDIEAFGLTNKDVYDETPNYGARSDIARYEILYRIGGLYVDTDFECLKSFDVLHHCCDFYSGAAAWDQVLIYCGLIGSAPGHPILKKCINSVRVRGNKKETCDDIQNRTGPYFLTRCFFNAVKDCTGPTVIFPSTYFYPWPHYEANNRNRDWIMRRVKPETFAIHHWHVSWAK